MEKRNLLIDPSGPKRPKRRVTRSKSPPQPCCPGVMVDPGANSFCVEVDDEFAGLTLNQRVAAMVDQRLRATSAINPASVGIQKDPRLQWAEDVKREAQPPPTREQLNLVTASAKGGIASNLESRALAEIASPAWAGDPDNGKTVDGPGKYASRDAFE